MTNESGSLKYANEQYDGSRPAEIQRLHERTDRLLESDDFISRLERKLTSVLHRPKSGSKGNSKELSMASSEYITTSGDHCRLIEPLSKILHLAHMLSNFKGKGLFLFSVPL
jgi:hypothetical protein